MIEEYVGPERRAANRTLDEVERVIDHKLQEHEERAREWFSAEVGKLRGEFSRAFPDGVDKHREYHQAKIDAAKNEAEFWKAAKLELAKLGVSAIFGVVKVLVILALIGAAFKVGLGPLVAKLVE